MALRIGWRPLLAGGAVAAMALAFVLVLTDGNQQSEMRQRARSALNAEGAACEALPSHGDRSLCRAALQPLPRDNSALAAWTPHAP